MPQYSDSEIEEMLLRKLRDGHDGESSNRGFLAGEELALAIRIISARVRTVAEKAERVQSVALAIESSAPVKAIKTVSDFPQNSVKLTALVSPSGNNGLCALPSRVDCLSGGGSTYPEIQLESDLSNSAVYSEPVDVSIDTLTSPPDTYEQICVKRMRIKQI